MIAQTDIPRLVREFRERTGLTQEQFVARLGFKFLTISRQESRLVKPSLRTLDLVEAWEGSLAGVVE